MSWTVKREFNTDQRAAGFGPRGCLRDLVPFPEKYGCFSSPLAKGGLRGVGRCPRTSPNPSLARRGARSSTTFSVTALVGTPRSVAACRSTLVCLGASVVIAVGLTFIGGCARGVEDEHVGGLGVTRTAQNGPVTITLSAYPETLTPNEHAKLTLEVLSEKGVTVLDNDYADALSEGDHRFEYRVARSDKQLAQPTDDGRLRWVYRFELEFFLPGEYELPPADVSFVEVVASDSDDDSDKPAIVGSDEVQTVATEPLTLVVRAIEGQAISTEELRNITRLDPIELPMPWYHSRMLLALVVVVIVIVGIWLVWGRRRRRIDAVVLVPAHEWARQQIAALIGDDLIGRGLVQEFHYRISAIVRGYIERRFGMSAPEMTTEEFLVAAANDARFGRDTTDELDRFLVACDLVKYACHQPEQGESEAALKVTGEFVERTRERSSPSAGDGASLPIEECAA